MTISLHGEREAVLADARTNKNIFVKEGDEINGVHIKEIREGSVILSYFDEEKELQLQ